MAKDKLLFQKTTSYDELLAYMEELIPDMSKYYFHSDSIEQAKASLHTLDAETRKKILAYANYVDKSMNFGGQARKNAYHKVPTVLAGAIYLDLYPDQVADLSLAELETLAKHSITLPLTFYKISKMYYTKELLAAINAIGPDYMYCTGYMFLTEKYFEQGKTPQEVTEYFLTADKKALLKESFDYEHFLIEEGFKAEEEARKNESRRV